MHQLLAARSHDLPDLGTLRKAVLFRKIALEIVIKAKLAEQMIATSSAILARPAGALLSEAQGITIAALALVDLQPWPCA